MDDLKNIAIIFSFIAFFLFIGLSIFVTLLIQTLPPSEIQKMKSGSYIEVFNSARAGTVNNNGLPATLAALVAAQAQHESANFTSSVFQNSYNAFGYNYDPSSPYAVGSYEGFAVYNSLSDSVSELVDYIWRRVADGSFPSDLSTITDPLQYATLLKNAKPGAYYADSISNYANGISNYFWQDALPVSGSDVAANNTAGNHGDLSAVILLIGLGFGLYYLFR